MIGSAFSAPTVVAMCYFQFISWPLRLQIAKWSAQPPSTQDESPSFHLLLKAPEGHGKRLLKYPLYIFSRRRAAFLILIRDVFCDRRLWKLRFPQILDLVSKGERGGSGKRS